MHPSPSPGMGLCCLQSLELGTHRNCELRIEHTVLGPTPLLLRHHTCLKLCAVVTDFLHPSDSPQLFILVTVGQQLYSD